MATWYCSKSRWDAVAAWAASTAYSIGDIVRQLATPSGDDHRCFRCTTAGTSGGSEPTWTLTKGGTTTDNTAVWTEITGDDAYNDTNSWLAPHASIDAACSWMAAGDRLYVANDHSFTRIGTSVAHNFTSPGTEASPCEIISVDPTNATPTYSAGATERGGTGNATFAFAGFAYMAGVTCESNYNGSNRFTFNSNMPWGWTLEDCKLRIVDTGHGTLSLMMFGTNSDQVDNNLLRLINTTVRFGNTKNRINLRCPVEWHGGGVEAGGAGVPATLFLTSNGVASGQFCGVGLDLSLITGSLVDVSGGISYAIKLQDCKLGGGVAITTGEFDAGGITVEVVNCDSGDTNYRTERYSYDGTVLHETTIVRTGGASDGVTALSHKFASSANTKFYRPLVGPWISFWNETTGSAVTVAAEVVTDNVTLTDAEAWIEVEYLGTSGVPLGSFASDRAADILATPANQTTSSATWTTTGLTTPVKQTLSKAVTPQEKGVIRARVCLAKASTTMYACPKLEVS